MVALASDFARNQRGSKEPARAGRRRCGRCEAHEAQVGRRRRAWDSNPRERSPVLAVFKTAALDHYASPPGARRYRIPGPPEIEGAPRWSGRQQRRQQRPHSSTHPVGTAGLPRIRFHHVRQHLPRFSSPPSGLYRSSARDGPHPDSYHPRSLHTRFCADARGRGKCA
jgi:hypothetical protein